MKFFAGRETDVFVTPQGQMIPGVSLCDRVIEDCRGIQQLQFVQNKLDELEVKIVKGNELHRRGYAEIGRKTYAITSRKPKDHQKLRGRHSQGKIRQNPLLYIECSQTDLTYNYGSSYKKSVMISPGGKQCRL